MNQAMTEQLQRDICRRFGSDFVPASINEKLGIAEAVRQGKLPINGLRHRPVGNTSGWYIWAGEELSNAADFFLPIHIEHLDDWCPQIRKFLGLAPGWRFLVADDYEDVWFDSSVLQVD